LEAFAYRLGNRSALEWAIDQYQVTTDKRGGIISDPNHADTQRYIVDTATQPIAWAQAIFEVSPRSRRAIIDSPKNASRTLRENNTSAGH